MSLATLSGVSAGKDLTLFRKLVDGSIVSVTAEDLGNITKIRNDSFEDCASLVSVEIPNTVTLIDAWAFNRCSSLLNIIIPDSVTQIGRGAYRDCTGARFVLIGNSVTTIAGYAFSGIAYAKLVYKPTTPPTLLESSSIPLSSSNVFYVPTPNDYRVATNWSAFANIIFPLVSTIADLSNIDTATYVKACVVGADESYKEYTYDGSQWNEVV